MLLDAAKKPELVQRLEAAGFIAHSAGRAATSARAARERASWEPIVRASGVVIAD